MGKVRIKTIGLEEDHKEEDKKARQNEAKKIEAAKRKAAKEQEINDKPEKQAEKKLKTSDIESTKETVADAKDLADSSNKADEKKEKEPVKKEKKEKFKRKSKSRSKGYKEAVSKLDKNKKYTITEALTLLKDLKRAKFDETVELHINTTEKGVSGSLTLPHGTGKQMKVEIADNAKDPKKLEALIKKIESGNIDFDILIATPDSMSHLARVARVLGPRGLMPNPKNGTVNPKPAEAAKKFEGGQINFKTEAKASIIHMSIGKLSFENNKLEDNIKAFIAAVQTKNIKNATLKSTMSPGIRLSI